MITDFLSDLLARGWQDVEIQIDELLAESLRRLRIGIYYDEAHTIGYIRPIDGTRTLLPSRTNSNRMPGRSRPPLRVIEVVELEEWIILEDAVADEEITPLQEGIAKEEVLVS